jgi:hypothetical protein
VRSPDFQRPSKHCPIRSLQESQASPTIIVATRPLQILTSSRKVPKPSLQLGGTDSLTSASVASSTPSLKRYLSRNVGSDIITIQSLGTPQDISSASEPTLNISPYASILVYRSVTTILTRTPILPALEPSSGRSGDCIQCVFTVLEDVEFAGLHVHDPLLLLC